VGTSDARFIRLKYEATCSSCSRRLEVGKQALWNPRNGHITCRACPQERHAYFPGASAQRKADQVAADERAEWRDASLVKKAAIIRKDAPPKARSWNRGAEGERLVGSLLEQLQMQGVIAVIHDVRVPRTAANVDHIAVAPSGIHVIDSKYYLNKRVEVAARGNIFGRDTQLLVDGRNRTNLVEKLGKQVQLVDSVTRDAELPTALTPVLCFVHARWAIFAKGYNLNGVHIVRPKRLREMLVCGGPLSRAQIEHAAALLRTRLRPA
jgi:hypothetical protein